jgi:hypothetical protein
LTIPTSVFLAWMMVCSLYYGVEPEFALAVARVESGTQAEWVRFGRLGRSPYYGPMGINKCFLNKWPIDNPYVNMEIGVKALRGPDKRRVLKRYNEKFDEGYFRAVMAAYQQHKRERIFEGGHER